MIVGSRSIVRFDRLRHLSSQPLVARTAFFTPNLPVIVSKVNMVEELDKVSTDYSNWSNQKLVERILILERQLKEKTIRLSTSKSKRTSCSPSRPTKRPRIFDPSKYSTRLIALKFAYLGQKYNGFEHHNNNITPLPSIEEELYKALTKAKLIFPTGNVPTIEGNINWDGCDYSKCGRTDRGVSAFGQVISLRVRSNRPKSEAESTEEHTRSNHADNGKELPAFDPILDELPYVQILNRILPEDIRVLAWCPSPPPEFSARFSCRERRYRYFFTQPAFTPRPGPEGINDRGQRDGWLDIDAMRTAAKYFEGSHDFRNFCKIDASKQITNFERHIFHASIDALDPREEPVGYVNQADFQPLGSTSNSGDANGTTKHPPSFRTPQIYSFNLHGSAFLWHQVRHMVAILFLVGQGLESPSVVPELLDTTKNPTKPMYEMATETPLVLWDCIFPDESSKSREDAIDWISVDDPRTKILSTAKGDGKFGKGGIVNDVWSIWRQKKIDEILAGTLLDLMVGTTRVGDSDANNSRSQKSTKYFNGGDSARLAGKYVPVLKRPRIEPVEIINARYAAKKGLGLESQVLDK